MFSEEPQARDSSRYTLISLDLKRKKLKDFHNPWCTLIKEDKYLTDFKTKRIEKRVGANLHSLILGVVVKWVEVCAEKSGTFVRSTLRGRKDVQWGSYAQWGFDIQWGFYVQWVLDLHTET